MFRILIAFVLASPWTAAADGPVVPKEPVRLFNGKDLTGLTTWLQDSKREDPKKVFRNSRHASRVVARGGGSETLRSGKLPCEPLQRFGSSPSFSRWPDGQLFP